MNVAKLLQDRASQLADATAILDVHKGQTRRMSFSELEQTAARTAAMLKNSGLRPGDTVLVFHPISAELYVALAAIFRLGVVAMVVDSSTGLQGITRCCQIRSPDAILVNSATHLLSLWNQCLRRIRIKLSTGMPIPGAVSLRQSVRLPYDATLVECTDDTPALVSFTSGSTGQPKAVVRTHGFLLAQHRVLEQNLQLRAGQVELATLPMFVLVNLGCGMTSLLPNTSLRRPDAAKVGPVVEQLQEHCPQRASGAPSLLERIADYCEKHQVGLPTLRRWLTGGGPVPLPLIDRLLRIAPNSDVTIVFGSSEAEPMTTISSREIDADDRQAMHAGRGLLVGRPVSAIQMRIVQDNLPHPLHQLTNSQFAHICLSAGKPGEIVVQGEHVLSSYLGRSTTAENSLTVDDVVWHRTGDAGFLDESGRLWLLGRCEAKLTDSRGTVYPLGVEQAAVAHPSVRRAAFLLLHDKRVLAIQLRPFADQPDLIQSLQSPAFSCVDDIRVMREIPVDARHNSKIDYEALRRRLARNVGRHTPWLGVTQ